MKVRTKAIIHDHVLDEFDHQNLRPNTVYAVLGIHDEYYRILDDRNDPILYPTYLFEIVDDTIPRSWVRREMEDGEVFIDPPEMSARAFWDRYHEGDPEATRGFAAYRARVHELGE